MSHTIFASFARDKLGNILHKGDKVTWVKGCWEYEVEQIKRGGNLTLYHPSSPWRIGVKSHNVTKVNSSQEA